MKLYRWYLVFDALINKQGAPHKYISDSILQESIVIKRAGENKLYKTVCRESLDIILKLASLFLPIMLLSSDDKSFRMEKIVP